MVVVTREFERGFTADEMNELRRIHREGGSVEEALLRAQYLAAISDRVQAFGTWDAPLTDEALWIDVPTHLKCMYCDEHFQAGDNGAIMPNGYAQHRECSLRGVLGGIGHFLDHARYCHGELGTDAGLSVRQSALLVWRHRMEQPVTEEELETLRRSFETFG